MTREEFKQKHGIIGKSQAVKLIIKTAINKSIMKK